MDVGCGPGKVTTKWVLPLFRDVKKIVALDYLPSMIEKATAWNAHPKVEYHVRNFEDRSAVESWKGQISKIVSIHCFNWFKNQKEGFQTAYDLLKPGGEAALYFELHSNFFTAVEEITDSEKWKSFFKGIYNYVPESNRKKYDSTHYRKMAESIGFEVLFCQSELKINKFNSHETVKGLYYSVCALVPYVPENRREEFKDDLYQCVLKHGNRNIDSIPLHAATTLELVVRKPK
ncbi:methyltransf_25 domain-containing protein [Nephila pilipes]|uniref:Methyltransf_25 domain-containing protein n=1 Tax=Nephila pilipes TaxID=299642 RepID=A0A8X6NWZ5_NEPPI|nr:methyltransf_25 domain-containing protein [Nephila pilipes]